MHEKTKTESGAGGLQRSPSQSEENLEALRQERRSVREGHRSGGYCDTEALHKIEKQIWQVLTARLDAAKKKHGYTPDPRFKHADIRAIELELDGLAWKPTLVVMNDDSTSH